MSCSYGDPSCPCQDGDPCHYEDTADTTAMTPPRPVAERRCNGCGHQWAGPAPVVLCGECWRKTWPFIWGGVNVTTMTQEIDAAIARLEAMRGAWGAYEDDDALVTALACLRDYVPREDRERAMRCAALSASSGDCYDVEARRLLKLEPQS